MVVNFNDYKWFPEVVVEEVMRFVNADMSKHKYKPLPPAMKVGCATTVVGCLHKQVTKKLFSLISCAKIEESGIQQGKLS